MHKTFIAPLLFAGALAAPLQARQKSLWQPQIGAKWQIVISQPIDTSTTVQPEDAEAFDVDLFYTTEQDVSNLHSQGKKVICYFSAGSSENWREDYGSFQSSDMGSGLEGWEGENWLDVRSENVLDVMKKRIDMAAEKGCDAIDPDNMGTLLSSLKRNSRNAC
jgi:hypothetical protein